MTNKLKKAELHKITFKRSKRNKWDFENWVEYENYYKRLKMLAVSVFEWKNLPTGIDSLYLERILYTHGKVVVFQDKDMLEENPTNPNSLEVPTLALPFAVGGKMNIYGIHKHRQAYAPNGYRMKLTDKDSIVMYDNILRSSLDDIINSYARRLAVVERIIDVNLNHTRHPYVVSTSEKQKDMMEELFNDIENNKPYIIADPSFAEMMVKGTEVFNLNAPFVVDKLMDYKHTLMNEVLTIIGIGNSSQDKRERLVSGEMDIVSTQNDAYALVRLRARKQALEQLKLMFPNEFKDTEVDFFQVKGVEQNGTQNHDSSNNGGKPSVELLEKD